MLFSLEVLLSLCRRVVAGGTAGRSGKEGSVMAGRMGAGVGSGIGTSMGSGIERSGAGGREARPSRPFVFIFGCSFWSSHGIGGLRRGSCVSRDRDGGGRRNASRRMGIGGLCVGDGAE